MGFMENALICLKGYRRKKLPVPKELKGFLKCKLNKVHVYIAMYCSAIIFISSPRNLRSAWKLFMARSPAH